VAFFNSKKLMRIFEKTNEWDIFPVHKQLES